MDVNQKIHQIEEKESEIEKLTRRLQSETERAQIIIAQEREVKQLRADIQTHMHML